MALRGACATSGPATAPFGQSFAWHRANNVGLARVNLICYLSEMAQRATTIPSRGDASKAVDRATIGRFSAHEATLCREARKNQNAICGLQLRMKDALPRLLIPP